MAETLACGDCGAPMELRPSKYGAFYGCTRFPECRGTHGAHPDGSPLGTPADSATRLARVRAHDAFDRLWQSGAMKRREAYAWMRETLQLSADAAHVGQMDVATCERLTAAVELYLSVAPSTGGDQ